MRGRAVAALSLGALASALATASACNPIFGIVSRTEGKTWCELSPQASWAYCDDFDRVSAATTAMETPDLLHGTTDVTDAESSSPPNSLEVHALEVTGDASALVSTLVNFGPSSLSGLPTIACSVDVRPSEIAALTTDIGVAALGAEKASPSGVGGAPELVFVSFGPSGVIARLASVDGELAPASPTGTPCPLFQMGQALDKPWVTLQMDIEPLEGGASGTMCNLGGRDAGAAYIAHIQFDAFGANVLVPPTRFTGQPYFAYGLSVIGASPAVTLHFDNAACQVNPEGGLF